MAIAKIGTSTYATMVAAAAALADKQTLYVTRSGEGAEVTAAFTNPGSFKIFGMLDAAGAIPKLQIDLYTKPAWGKAVLDLEVGTHEVAYLHIDGCAVPDSNGAAIRVNSTATEVNVHHVRLTNNENGILTGSAKALNIWDSVFDGNGKSTTQERRGYSHNIYAGELEKLTAARVSFLNSAYGHDFKSRAAVTMLTQVLCEGSAHGRAVDLSNGGVLLATDCAFVKHAGAEQNNLIDIGAENIKPGREERYELTNCLFHNDVDPTRDVQFIRNRSTKEVVLVDPLFTGAAANKNQKQTLTGNIRIVLTGGPLGPRVPVGGDPGPTSTVAVPAAGTDAPATSTPPVTATPTPSPAPAPSTTIPATVTKVILEGDITVAGGGTWSKIGAEGSTVSVPADTLVRYGAKDKYVYAKVGGKFVASNTFFGKDPASGYVKNIDQFVPNVVAAPAPTPTPTPAPSSGDGGAALAAALSTLLGRTVTVTIK